MKKRLRKNSRNGYVTVLFAMLLFGLMAMAALVIDIGFARLAQRQMQSAADPAALEGLRGQGSLSYEQRQFNAAQFVAWHFDDDLDETNGDDGVAGGGGAFGGGPIVQFSGGVGEPALSAGQLLTVDSENAVYQPVMQPGDETLDEFRLSIQRRGSLIGQANLFAEGPAVPYLFARGSLLNRQLIGAGITVRADSTASAQRALRIGAPVFNSAGELVLPGAIAFGFTITGQPVVAVGSVPTLPDGYAAIFDNVLGVDRVVGFGLVSGGVPVTTAPASVATGNAVSRLSDVWAELDPAFRNTVLSRNAAIQNGLHVATPKALR